MAETHEAASSTADSRTAQGFPGLSQLTTEGSATPSLKDVHFRPPVDILPHQKVRGFEAMRIVMTADVSDVQIDADLGSLVERGLTYDQHISQVRKFGLYPVSQELLQRCPDVRKTKDRTQMQVSFATPFRGMNHSRLLHQVTSAVGMRRVGSALGLPQRDLELLQVGALTHDGGHGPFSHGGEDAINALIGQLRTAVCDSRVELGRPIAEILDRLPDGCVPEDFCHEKRSGELITRGFSDHVGEEIGTFSPVSGDRKDTIGYILHTKGHDPVFLAQSLDPGVREPDQTFNRLLLELFGDRGPYLRLDIARGVRQGVFSKEFGVQATKITLGFEQSLQVVEAQNGQRASKKYLVTDRPDLLQAAMAVRAILYREVSLHPVSAMVKAVLTDEFKIAIRTGSLPLDPTAYGEMVDVEACQHFRPEIRDLILKRQLEKPFVALMALRFDEFLRDGEDLSRLAHPLPPSSSLSAESAEVRNFEETRRMINAHNDSVEARRAELQRELRKEVFKDPEAMVYVCLSGVDDKNEKFYVPDQDGDGKVDRVDVSFHEDPHFRTFFVIAHEKYPESMLSAAERFLRNKLHLKVRDSRSLERTMDRKALAHKLFFGRVGY